MIYYLIRHKASGKFMPQSKKSKGYTHWNPSDPSKIFLSFTNIPRLIETEKKAKGIITQWNANPNLAIRINTSFNGDDYSLDSKPDGRKKEDLEVVKVKLLIVKVK